MDGAFASLKGVTVRFIKRHGMMKLPPFDNITLREHDILQFAGTRAQVQELVDLNP